jgi:uracil-DNA glycosylase
MLQYEIVRSLAKPAARSKVDAARARLGSLPIDVLRPLNSKLVTALHKAKVRTLSDFVRRADAVQALVPANIVQLLYCLLFWPAYDPGPPCAWQQLFAQAPLSSFQSLPATFRLDFGPVYYRGRLDGTARVLVVGQDPSTDEILAERIFIGQAGQRLQKLLRKLGLTRSYVMFNTYLYSVYGQYNDVKSALQANPAVDTAVRKFRNMLLDKAKSTNSLEAVLAFGTAAHDAVAQWPGASGLTCFNLTHPTATDATVVANWNSHLAQMQSAITPDQSSLVDPSPCAAITDPAAFADVPRQDLPFGIPSWHGTGGGTHSKRSGATQIIWSTTTV